MAGDYTRDIRAILRQTTLPAAAMKKGVITLCVVAVATMASAAYRVRPRTIAKERGPQGEFVHIVEVPSGDISTRLMRDNPRYRFEYRLADGYLWSAFSFHGESFYPRSARVRWTSDTKAECFLDEHLFGVFEDRVWSPR